SASNPGRGGSAACAPASHSIATTGTNLCKDTIFLVLMIFPPTPGCVDLLVPHIVGLAGERLQSRCSRRRCIRARQFRRAAAPRRGKSSRLLLLPRVEELSFLDSGTERCPRALEGIGGDEAHCGGRQRTYERKLRIFVRIRIEAEVVQGELGGELPVFVRR